MSATRGRILVPLNILQACIEDLRLGHTSNARSCLPLIFNPPGSKAYNPLTQAGPSTFSEDENAFLRNSALPLQWNNLYSTWNLAFVSHYPNFPFFFAKLLIPQVSNYQQTPSEYMYNRALALYTHIQYEVFSRSDIKESDNSIDVSDVKPSRFWGDANLESAREYQKALIDCNPGVLRSLQNVLLGTQ